MSTLSASFGKAGPGITQTIGDKSWTLTRSTKAIQAAWGKWFAERVEASVMDTAASYRKRSRALAKDIENWQREERGDDQPAPARGAELALLIEEASKEQQFLEFEARAVIERFNDRRGAGEFEYHGNASLSLALFNLPGQFQLAWLCLLPKHPTVTLDEVIDSFRGHGKEWGEFLIKSEGVGSKNVGAAPSVSTPTSTETQTEPAPTISTPSPTAPPAAPP